MTTDLAPVSGYSVAAERPIAPSEASKDWSILGRRAIGGAGVGTLAGALGAKALGVDPMLGGAIGGSAGLAHGALRAREQMLGDRVTQERMAMREAMREMKKQKKASIDPMVLRSMRLELMKMAQPTAAASPRARVITDPAARGTTATAAMPVRPPARPPRAPTQGGRAKIDTVARNVMEPEAWGVVPKSTHTTVGGATAIAKKGVPQLGAAERVGQKVVGGLNRLSGGRLGSKLHNVAGERALARGAGAGQAGIKGLRTIGHGAMGAGALAAAGLGVAGLAALRHRRQQQQGGQ